MRRHFIAVSPDEEAENVLRLMGFARVRWLPVVERGVLRGLVAYRALALAKLEDLRAGRGVRPRSVAELMEPPGSTLASRASLATAARELCGAERGCVPVVEPSAVGSRVVGIVTEHDLLEALFRTVRTSPTPG